MRFNVLFVLLFGVLCSSCQSDGLMAGTLVTKLNSEMGAVQVPIEKLVPGDTLLVYSGKYGPISSAAVIKTFRSHGPVISIKTGDGILHLSSDHLVYLSGMGFVRAGSLKLGDSLLYFDLKRARFISSVITRIGPIIGEQTLYNLEVDTWHDYLADGLVVHNKNESLVELVQFWGLSACLRLFNKDLL